MLKEASLFLLRSGCTFYFLFHETFLIKLLKHREPAGKLDSAFTGSRLCTGTFCVKPTCRHLPGYLSPEPGVYLQRITETTMHEWLFLKTMAIAFLCPFSQHICQWPAGWAGSLYSSASTSPVPHCPDPSVTHS